MKCVLIAAITVNGEIAHSANETVSWTSKEDKKFFTEETKRHGVVIMGKKTYDTIGKPLSGRLNVVLTRSPEEYESIPGTLEFTNEPLPRLLQGLEERGFASVAVAGGASVYTQFVKEGLIDEMFITVEPRIFGSGIGIFSDFDIDKSLRLLSVTKLGEHGVLLHYEVEKSSNL